MVTCEHHGRSISALPRLGEVVVNDVVVGDHWPNHFTWLWPNGFSTSRESSICEIYFCRQMLNSLLFCDTLIKGKAGDVILSTTK